MKWVPRTQGILEAKITFKSLLVVRCKKSPLRGMFLSSRLLSVHIIFCPWPPFYYLKVCFATSCSSSYLKQDPQIWVGYDFLRKFRKLIPRTKSIPRLLKPWWLARKYSAQNRLCFWPLMWTFAYLLRAIPKFSHLPSAYNWITRPCHVT